MGRSGAMACNPSVGIFLGHLGACVANGVRLATCRTSVDVQEPYDHAPSYSQAAAAATTEGTREACTWARRELVSMTCRGSSRRRVYLAPVLS